MMDSNKSDIVYVLFEWRRFCVGFLSFVFICIAVGAPVIRGRVGIPLAVLSPPHFCTCPKRGPVFPTSDFVVFGVQ